ncbi:putative membrane protein [Bradyrhizobium betae]|nr:putative membrane protein [Bradyrhizobium betae]
MEHLLQIVAAGALLGVFYLYVALAYVLMFAVKFWPVVLFFALLLAVVFFARRKKQRDS